MNQGLPFGAGKRGSGYGRFGGQEGLRALCSPKAIVQDRFFGIIQTKIPAQLAYPVDGQAAVTFTTGMLKAVYASGLERLWGVKALLTA